MLRNLIVGWDIDCGLLEVKKAFLAISGRQKHLGEQDKVGTATGYTRVENLKTVLIKEFIILFSFT